MCGIPAHSIGIEIHCKCVSICGHELYEFTNVSGVQQSSSSKVKRMPQSLASTLQLCIDCWLFCLDARMHSFQNRVALSKATSLQRQTLRLVSNALPGIYFHECLAQIQHVNTCKMSSPFPLPHFEKVETSAKNLISGPNDNGKFLPLPAPNTCSKSKRGRKGEEKKINRTPRQV